MNTIIVSNILDPEQNRQNTKAVGEGYQQMTEVAACKKKLN